MRFRDREDAGQRLADLLDHYRGHSDVVVLALPRGGVPVARVVADRLEAPMDLLLVRKLGVPGREELAMGAIADGDIVLNQDVVRHVEPHEVERVIQREREELRRRNEAYGRTPLEVEGRTVIVVDDGLATGATMRASVQALAQRKPGKVVVAVPTAPEHTVDEFAEIVDEVVCVMTPKPFGSVGQAYKDFSQTTDGEVRRLLTR
ncbi:phosphoribosyltransferase [Kibdelosporangium persicum]|uniref:Phosphoribosyltransferase n=1 Tax=Kibdelosporangium persicum TaxID=2698649 RepID=A0ABX2F5M3_9PSEU|nr:phosphoribosyltransferase family protein [Kibdelosporangium persicum]NRN66612.1 putative phosphoribosyltransferase [Kibdelosporangium persicum]